MNSQLAILPRSLVPRAQPQAVELLSSSASAFAFEGDAGLAAASRVMIVDDEGSNLFLLREILDRAQLRNVTGFRDPVAALDAATGMTPDLILLDIRMPVLDGYSFLAALRERLPEADVPAVLMMTGDTSAGTKLRALEVGATDFVAKPFDSSELLLRIRNALRTRALQTQIQRQNHRLEAAVRERTSQLEEALYRAESAARAKAEFLSKVSHEMRTPLTPLIGALEMLAETKQSEVDGTLIDMATRSANRLNRLVGDILLLQRLEQGVVEPDVTPVRLVALLRRVVERLAPDSASRIHISVDLADEHATLLTDEAHLEDVVRRIVENALRFSPSGSTVTIDVETPSNDSPIAIDVADEGPGIPEERREAMFAAFEQIDNTSVRAHEGAGLGLAICRRLCEVLGATLGAADRPEGGTIFRIGLHSLDRRHRA